MLRLSTLAIAAFAAYASAQTHTDCDPRNVTCAPDLALGTSFNQTFDKSLSAFDTTYWNVTAGASLVSFGQNGAQLALKKSGDSVTVQSNFFIMFGTMEILFQAAAGQGIISTAILISDDLDEIDWEVKGTNTAQVSSNYYGWGVNYDAQMLDLANAQTGFHNYTVDWTKERLNFILDGNVMRSVPYNESGWYPQTPCQLRFGLWAAGDVGQPNGTVQWAGGPTDWSQGPFNMFVKSVRVIDSNTNVTSYSYGDHSGTYQSIKMAGGQSAAYKAINHISSTQQAINSFNGLSTAAKIGIAAGVLGGISIAMLAFCIWCCLQRKQGREEKRLADKEWNDQQNELLAYKRMQQQGKFAISSADYRQSNKF